MGPRSSGPPENGEVPAPVALMKRMGPRKTRKKANSPIFLVPPARKALTSLGAPSYTSTAHAWNGTSVTLNASPAMRNPYPRRTRTGNPTEPVARPIAYRFVVS